MKKILCCLLLVLVLTASVSPALAACQHHPNAAIHVDYTSSVSILSHKYHVYHYVETYYCDLCGSYLGKASDVAYEEWEVHFFSGGRCTICGYREDGYYTPQDTVSEYNEEELQTQALLLGDQLIGAKAIVVREGNIRAEADEYSKRIGGAFLESEFIIKDYFINSRYRVWLQIEYAGREAWISASLVKVIVSNAIDGDNVDPSWFIDRQCKIITSSGRARYAPDVNAPIIAYVHYGEYYRIRDCRVGADGKLWFKIMFDGDPCWISSSLAEYY